MEQQNNTMIRIEALTKTYAVPGGTVDALKGIDLEIRQGEIFGIIGMSGAGRSTLIRCMNLLECPTSGTIQIDGQDVTGLSKKALRQMRHSVGMIFQQFNLLMQTTVEKNIAFPLEITGVDRAQCAKRVKELLEIVGLSDKADAYPAQLSGGQKQRVAIARALAANPKVLLCDEATSALDPMTTDSILELLKRINQQIGITIVVITHEMEGNPQDLPSGGDYRRRRDRRARRSNGRYSQRPRRRRRKSCFTYCRRAKAARAARCCGWFLTASSCISLW